MHLVGDGFVWATNILARIASGSNEVFLFPKVGNLGGPLWEMRMRGKDGTSRALYVTIREKRGVVIRVFTKKTRETPRREIDLALQRAKRILD